MSEYHLCSELACVFVHASQSRIRLTIKPYILIVLRAAGNRAGKEADETIVPYSLLQSSNFCPSVVVEVGCSEPFEKLVEDKNWWVNYGKGNPHGTVNYSLTL